MSSVEARDQALEALYEADVRQDKPNTDGLRVLAVAMVEGVWGERDDLDSVIGDAATGWRVRRMPPVDRNILRLAVWELRHRDRTPVPVVISEAVRLAKTYSTERSGGFINGVLGGLVATEREPAG